MEETTNKPRIWTMIAGVILGFLYLLFCALVSIGIYQKINNDTQPIPTTIPTLITTPTPLFALPEGDWETSQEDFSNNKRNWGLFYNQGKIEILDGKMLVQSYLSDRYAIAIPEYIFIPPGEKYYRQVELITDTETDIYSTYGLVFGMDERLGTFYLFEILQRETQVRLLKQSAGKWEILTTLTDAPISKYPKETTLGVYVDKGTIELYVNGEMISRYKDENPFQSKNFGIYIGGTNARVIVDNIITYDGE